MAAVAPGFRPGLADGLPAFCAVEPGPGVGQAAPRHPRRTRRQRRLGLVEVRHRLRQCPGGKRGPLTGPNPTDRGKPGSKIHLITDRNGLPLSLGISGANMHDSLGLKPLVCGTRPSAPAADHAADVRPNSMPTRDTTMTACGDGCAREASATASPAKASSLHSASAGTVGWSSGPCPGWPGAAAYTAATNAKPNTSSPSSPLPQLSSPTVAWHNAGLDSHQPRTAANRAKPRHATAPAASKSAPTDHVKRR